MRRLTITATLFAALAAPASASASAKPMISPAISAHWTSQPSPTGTADITALVKTARTVTVTANGHTWSLKRKTGGSLPRWFGAVKNRSVTNYFARPSFTIKLKACNSAGCVTATRKLHNG